MAIPGRVLEAVGDLVDGGPVPESAASVGGGDINQAASLRDRAGGRWFVKWNASAPAGMFVAEAEGLLALGEAAAEAGADLRVPSVGGCGDAEGIAWLLMEDVSPESAGRGRGEARWERRLGRGLATLHRRTAETGDGSYGWESDNWIGRLPQRNTPSDDWSDFWRDRRLAPQALAAHEAGLLSDAERAELDRLLDRIDVALEGAQAEGPSLLHGDLWGGNVMESDAGRAALYDPAVYRGHREVDLAMSELFGFPPGFMPAYREVWPVDAAYEEVRRDVYQLYYLLVHVNLFGRGYAAGAVAAARRVLART